MKLLALGFILILTSKGQSWNVSVPTNINATLGSNVTINCSFTYPTPNSTDKIKVYWKKIYNESTENKEQDKNPFVYHSNHSLVLEHYRNRTRLIGDQTKGNCSLMIINVTKNESNLYVRVEVNKHPKYSFAKNCVSISVSGKYDTQDYDSDTTQMYVAIFVPVSVLVIIIVVGIVCFIKCRRSPSFTREDSGYYANFSRASSNQTKRIQTESTVIKYENTQRPQPKTIDEPVYINTEVATGQVDQSMDITEIIYVNIDYSK